MVLNSVLAIAWSVGGFTQSTLPYGFDYQMDITGNTGYITSAVFGSNDVVYYFDVVCRFDLSYLTNDDHEVPQTTYDLAVYFKSISGTCYYHSNLSDYVESYNFTLTIDKFFDYGDFSDIGSSFLYTEFSNDNVDFSLKYDLDGFTYLWEKDNLTNYYSTSSEKWCAFPPNTFLSAVRSGFGQFSYDAYNQGYSDGRAVGYQEGRQEDATIASIFSGILEVGLVPINFFLAIFNFEIMGINITSFVTALLTVCLVIILFRTLFGGGGDQ